MRIAEVLSTGFPRLSGRRALRWAHRRLLLYKTTWANGRSDSVVLSFTESHQGFGPTYRWTFIIAAICGVTGILVTYFFVPDMTGVDLADEDRKFMEYLSSSGWQGEIGEDDDKEILTADNQAMDAEADSDIASTK